MKRTKELDSLVIIAGLNEASKLLSEHESKVVNESLPVWQVISHAKRYVNEQLSNQLRAE